MASYALDYEPLPSIQPAGGMDNDFSRVQTSAENFGGAVARGGEQLGQGGVQAGEAGIEFATQKARLDDDTMANDQFVGQTQAATQAWGQFANNNQGQAAAAALPAFQQNLEQIRQKGLAALPNPIARNQFDNAFRRIQMHYLETGQTYADSQKKIWQTNSLKSGATEFGNQAVLNRNNPQSVDTFLNTSDQQIRDLGSDSNWDDATVSRAVEENRGRNVRNLVGTLASEGRISDAEAMFNKYSASIDAGSRLAIQKALRPAIVKQKAQSVADQAMQEAGGTSGLIRHFEGFRSNAYWDVNHWRTGYGSDTVTLADGTVQPVTAFTQVTQADAERDLERRINLTQQGIRETVGDDTWRTLSPRAQASLTSVAYNYGHLPASVAAAVQSGDDRQIAQAILGLSGDNGGVNAQRRALEAANITGQHNYLMDRATAVARAGALAGSDPEVQREAIAAVNRQFTAQRLQGQAEAESLKMASQQAQGGYIDRILNPTNGQIDPNIIHEISADPNLLPDTKKSLYEFAQSASGHTDTSAYGAGYTQAYKAIVAPPGDPERITDSLAILRRAAPGGDLTPVGAQKLLQVLHETQKSVDAQGIHTAKSSLLNYAKSRLSFEQDTGPIKIRDPKGEAIYNAQFVPAFEAAYSKWVSDGKSPTDFLTKENVDKIMAPFQRSKSQMAMDRMVATGESAPADDPSAPPPPAPTGVDPGAWTKIVTAPPPSDNGTPFPRTAWATALQMLVQNPSPQNRALFNASKFGRAGYDADQLLQQLTPKHEAMAGGQN